MGALSWLIVGLVVGAIASTLVPPAPRRGARMAILLAGVFGGVAGGLVAAALDIGSVSRFIAPSAWILALAGAVLLVLAYRAVTDEESDARTVRFRDERPASRSRFDRRR